MSTKISPHKTAMQYLIRIAFFWVTLIVSSYAYAQVECQTTNENLQKMYFSEVVFHRPDKSVFKIKVRTADTVQTRSAGFQYVCQETISKTPILFLFDSAVMPSFHMNNVVANIDIAFILKSGEIDSIHAMQTYSLVSKKKPRYAPNLAIIAALETHPDFYQQHRLENATVSWQPLSQ